MPWICHKTLNKLFHIDFPKPNKYYGKFLLIDALCIRNCLSEKGNLKGGVPQGSVLGPLLFLLYINDIADNTQSFSRLFADDTSLLYSSNSINEI
jgi:hypothetical protein